MLHSRPLAEWSWLLFPMVLLLEVPRYYLPALGLLALKLTGRLGPSRDAGPEPAQLAEPPLVTVVVAGRNESAAIESCVASLLDQTYPNLEIIVVDDASEDGMAELVRPFLADPRVRLVRNASHRGRGGRPSATNLGLRFARGELLLSLDADTSFDRNMVRHMVAPFADPRVGVVAGNVLPANWDANLLTHLQAFEYHMAIDLWKRWASRFGTVLQASGALGAFRVSAVRGIGGWDPELAEDTDVSMRMIRAGYRIAFAHQAGALTEVPTTARALARQRARWDRGGLRTFFSKHLTLLDPRRAGWPIALELASEGFFFLVTTLVFPLYLLWLASLGLETFLVVCGFSYAAYTLLTLSMLVPIRALSLRPTPARALVGPLLLMPVYKEWMRYVRLRALAEDFLLIRVEDGFLPASAWAHKRRF